MRDLIRDAEIDIIGLLESDTQRLIGGNRDFTQTIAEDLGMYVDYGPGLINIHGVQHYYQNSQSLNLLIIFYHHQLVNWHQLFMQL